MLIVGDEGLADPAHFLSHLIDTEKDTEEQGVYVGMVLSVFLFVFFALSSLPPGSHLSTLTLKQAARTESSLGPSPPNTTRQN